MMKEIEKLNDKIYEIENCLEIIEKNEVVSLIYAKNRS